MRNGMWVMHGGKVGIVFTKNESHALVHLVDENGETVDEAVVAVGELRQATLAEIPASRRPSAEVGAKYGYV